MKLFEMTAVELAGAIKRKEMTALDVTESFLRRIDEQSSSINCFTSVTRDRALEEARKIDGEINAGKDVGPLAGVPYAAKNLFDIKGLRTAAGSRVNMSSSPSSVDAPAISQMQQAGAILVGALNMDEFAYGFTNENTHYGAVRNPHDPSRVAGGSSGGSAASVAAGFVPISLGSDTNGSIRLPAALCGTFGLKPTFGRLDRSGCFPLSSSLDTIGAFARSTADLLAAYRALSASEELATRPKLANLRIGVATGYFQENASAEVWSDVQSVAEILNVSTNVTIPEAARARAAAYVITASEAGNVHFDNLNSRYLDFEPRSRGRLLAGAISPAAWYLQAQKFRSWFDTAMTRLLDDVDVIIVPASPQTAPEIGCEAIEIAGQQVSPRAFLGMFTQPISFIGLPVITAPIVKPGALPSGVQIIAPRGREEWCFAVASHLENTHPHVRSVVASSFR